MRIRSPMSAGLAALAVTWVGVSSSLEGQHADSATTVSIGDDVDPRCRAEMHRSSDYALGHWVGTVKIQGPDDGMEIDRTVRTEARLELAAGGCAIVERRIVRRDGRPRPNRVLTVRAYDPDEDR